MTTKCRNRIVNLGIGEVQNDVFRRLETLEGTFIRTHMSQSCLGCILEVLLSGLEAGNVNNDHKMPILGCKNTHWKGKF